MNGYKIIDKCLLCEGATQYVLRLGETPLANEFVSTPQKQDMFPLNLIQCQKCNHVQLDCIVNEDRLYKNYLYVTGTSQVNVEHFEEYAESVKNQFFGKWLLKDNSYGYANSSTILDIGSNDGTFLKHFIKDFDVLGVDPAENIAKTNNIPTFVGFFNEETARKIKTEYPNKKFQIITCNNMFAHNKNLKTIVKGVDFLLEKEGIFIIENSYLLDMVDNTLVDLIYHEHMHHHHIRPLQQFFKDNGFDIYKVERLPNHGGSFRAYICRSEINRKIDQSVYDCLDSELNINDKIKSFENKIKTLKEKISNRLSELKSHGADIIVYGFPAKSTTLLYAFDIDKSLISFGIDDAILKQNMFSPGKNIPIYHPDMIYKLKPDVLLILGWNFADSIIANHKDFKGTWIVPLSEYKEINA